MKTLPFARMESKVPNRYSVLNMRFGYRSGIFCVIVGRSYTRSNTARSQSHVIVEKSQDANYLHTVVSAWSPMYLDTGVDRKNVNVFLSKYGKSMSKLAMCLRAKGRK